MAIIEYREFKIHTEEHCDAKNPKRHPVQLRDRAGYHFGYYQTVAAAERAADGWWIWNARLANA